MNRRGFLAGTIGMMAVSLLPKREPTVKVWRKVQYANPNELLRYEEMKLLWERYFGGTDVLPAYSGVWNSSGQFAGRL